MEQRKITIISTKTQKKYVINTGAETLADLKTDLNSHNIDYADMTFMEGLTKTELNNNAAVLPTNVKRTNRETGEVTYTNELVFMLTNTNKKIKSGVMTRKEAYEEIKTKGLAEAVKDVFGKSFTNVSTEQLLEFLNTESTGCECELVAVSADNCKCNCKDIILTFIVSLVLEGIISKEEILEALSTENDDTECPYSDEELDEMFN